MPLFLAALTIAIASYMAYQRIRFKNCEESRTLLHVLYFTNVNFVILHHCSEPYTGYPQHIELFLKFYCKLLRPFINLLRLTFPNLYHRKTQGGRYYLRSNNGKLLNIPPCKSLSTLGDRSFYMAAPKLWNDLPLFIRNISSVNAFKNALKTHLVQKAFPS